MEFIHTFLPFNNTQKTRFKCPKEQLFWLFEKKVSFGFFYEPGS